MATVSSDRTTPSPWQVGHGRVMISRTPSVTFWAASSRQAELGDLGGEVFVRSSSSVLRRVLSTASRFLARAMSMKSMTMMPADVAQAQLVDHRFGGLEVRPRDRVLQRACLPRPTNEPE